MADNLILVTVKSKTIGSDNIYKDNNVKPSNIVTYPTPQQQAVDILNLATPIRYNPNTGLTYFSVRDNASTQKENRNVGICYYTCTDSITTLAAGSADLVSLTVVKRRLEVIASEVMLFQTSKIIGVIDVDGNNSRFQYLEDGDPNLVMYEVTQTPAQIVAAGVSPVFNMNGYELYVNDIVGNDATAEFGNPLLPWATFDGAVTAAKLKAYPTNIIITGGIHTASNNFFQDGVNVEIKADATLTASAYVATGAGNQIITGKGKLISGGHTTMYADTSFSGKLSIDVGTFEAISGAGIWNKSTSGGVINVACDYSIMDTGCDYLYEVTGTSNEGSFNTRVLHTDNSTERVSTFYITPSSLVAGNKVFNFYIASGNSVSSNEGVLTLSAIDSTYEINAELNVTYNGSTGSPGLNAILSCYNCTGGVVNLKGTQYIKTQGRCALIVNSTININDYSNTYYTTTNPNSVVLLTGGQSMYNLYGKKFSQCTVKSIILGSTFTSTSATTDFGTVTGTAGSDTLHYKGSMKCTYMNNAAIGVFVDNGNANLVIDGGIIEMVNSNTTNDAISATSPQNIKVLGTGFVRGAVNGNITNTITGTNIIQDTGVRANII